jgi:S1-C subfamily serine protease
MRFLFLPFSSSWIVLCFVASLARSGLLLCSSSNACCCHAFAVPNSSSHNRNSSNGLSKLSVSELKRLLSERNIDFRDCLEKYELVQRLEQQPSSSGAGGGRRSRGTTGYTEEHASATAAARRRRTEHENSVIDTFKRVSPCVAYITTTTTAAAGGGRSFSLQQQQVPTGAGSGFLWDDQGHVVTNAHVVLAGGGRRSSRGGHQVPPQTVKVKLQGMANAYDAVVVGIEPDKDLAVLKLPYVALSTSNLPAPIQVGTSDDLEVGQSVLAIGNPFGLDNTLTTGVVSAVGRDVQGFGGRTIKGCVQTDASINPGNSGGCLLDSSGRLVGVNTAIFTTTGGNVGIGFAIPVDTVRRVVNQIIRYGRVVRPTLGIHIAEDRIVSTIEMQLGRSLHGVLVAEVLPNSPAERAGMVASTQRGDGTLRLGDLITAVDGQPVKQAEDLLSAIEERKEGDVVTLHLHRNCDPRRMESVQARLVSRDSLHSSSDGYTTTDSRSRRNGQQGQVNMAHIWE